MTFSCLSDRWWIPRHQSIHQWLSAFLYIFKKIHLKEELYTEEKMVVRGSNVQTVRRVDNTFHLRSFIVWGVSFITCGFALP